MAHVDANTHIPKVGSDKVVGCFPEGSKERDAILEQIRRYSDGQHALVLYKEMDGDAAAAVLVGPGCTHETLLSITMGSPFLATEEDIKLSPVEYCLLG